MKETKLGLSLSGKNAGGNASSVGSSPAAPSKGKNFKYWKKRLSKLDSELSEWDSKSTFYLKFKFTYSNLIEKWIKLDKKRKEVRLRLKGYK